MLLKTSELTGLALDYAVAQCEGLELITNCTHPYYWGYDFGFSPSTDWSQGGPIIEREEIELTISVVNLPWVAHGTRMGYGPTLLIAAMRCYVASKLGDEVEIPTELLEK